MTRRTAHAPRARAALARVLRPLRQQDADLLALRDDARLTPAELEVAIAALDASTPGSSAVEPGPVGTAPAGGRR